MTNMSLIWLVLLPVIGGFICYLLQRWKVITTIITVGIALFSLVVTFQFISVEEMTSTQISWFNLQEFNFNLLLKVTPLGGLIAFFAAGLATLIILYTIAYEWKSGKLGRMSAFILWALAGTLGAFLAGDLITFLICWEVVTLTFYMLIQLGDDQEKAQYSAAKSFSILGFSDYAMILGIGYLVFSRTFTNIAMDNISFGVTGTLDYIAFLLFFVGVLAKAGGVPFHSWLPTAASGAPTPVMAFLPASLDKLLGIYLLARVSLALFAVNSGLRLLVMIVGAITILGAVLMALIQHDLKRLLSFHAVSQVGYMILGFGTGTVIGIIGGLFHMLNNAIYKGCLFLCAGSVEKKTGTTDLEKLSGLAKVMPVTFFATVIAALSISGIPPFNGFASKWLVYLGTLNANTNWAPFLLVAAIFGSGLTLASFIKVLHSVFFGEKMDVVTVSPKKTPFLMKFSMIILAILCIVLGIWAQIPAHKFLVTLQDGYSDLPYYIDQATFVITDMVNGMWSPGAATVLILLGVGLGALIYLIGGGFNVREVPPFTAGEDLTPEQRRFTGPQFYLTIEKFPILKDIYRNAKRSVFDIYRLGGLYGSVFVRLLRKAHSGVLPTYVNWNIIGLIIIVVFLIKFV